MAKRIHENESLAVNKYLAPQTMLPILGEWSQLIQVPILKSVIFLS
jgi:hypothetical protein